MQTNTRLAMANFTLSASGICGVSFLAVSLAFSSPDNQRGPAGGYVIVLVNSSTVVPLHIEPRMTYTDMDGVTQEAPFAHYLVSNTQAFGGSAFAPRSTYFLTSGQAMAVKLDSVVGSGLRVYVLAASNASAVVSGQCSIWRV